MRTSQILRACVLLIAVVVLPGCQTCCYRGKVGKLEALSSLQNPTQVANDIWTRLLANHFRNESRIYRFSFTDEPVWYEKPGSEIRRFVYAEAAKERHVRVVSPQDATYRLGVTITDEPEGKEVVFTLTTAGEKDPLVVYTTTLAEPSLNR